MEALDILKIVGPVIIAVCATVFTAVKWTMGRQEITNQMYRDESKTFQKQFDKRTRALEETVQDFRVLVAKDYMPRASWLEHALSMERKLDNIRSDVSSEMKNINKLIMERLTQ